MMNFWGSSTGQRAEAVTMDLGPGLSNGVFRIPGEFLGSLMNFRDH